MEEKEDFTDEDMDSADAAWDQIADEDASKDPEKPKPKTAEMSDENVSFYDDPKAWGSLKGGSR